MNLVLIGPQGSGKGTQAELMSSYFKLPRFSVGELLRDNARKKTPLGLKAEKYMLKGVLVPKKIMKELIESEINKKKYKKGMIFDGYPRNMEQVNMIKNLVEIDYAVLIDISPKVTVERLSSRRVCPQCGENYNLLFKKPKKDNLCNECGEKLIQRKDDKPAAIKERLRVYKKETGPVIDYYQNQGKLVKVNGEQPIKEVFEEVIAALESTKG